MYEFVIHKTSGKLPYGMLITLLLRTIIGPLKGDYILTLLLTPIIKILSLKWKSPVSMGNGEWAPKKKLQSYLIITIYHHHHHPYLHPLNQIILPLQIQPLSTLLGLSFMTLIISQSISNFLLKQDEIKNKLESMEHRKKMMEKALAIIKTTLPTSSKIKSIA